MIFLTAFAIGACSFLLRSTIGCALVACLIALSFAAACLAMGTLVSLWSLLSVYAGFNAGLVTLFVSAVAIETAAPKHRFR
jgi:hypothetical protein